MVLDTDTNDAATLHCDVATERAIDHLRMALPYLDQAARFIPDGDIPRMHASLVRWMVAELTPYGRQ